MSEVLSAQNQVRVHLLLSIEQYLTKDVDPGPAIQAYRAFEEACVVQLQAVQATITHQWEGPDGVVAYIEGES